MTLRAAAVALLLLPATAGATTIDAGTITVGKGVNGAELGMKRGQVIEALGTPLDENANGVMSYQPYNGRGILDVYRDPKRVRMFVVSFVRSSQWRLQDGNRIFTRGAIGRVYRHYGRRVRTREDETGSLYYYVRSRLRGRRVETAFLVDRFGRRKAQVLDVFINLR